MTAHDEQRHGQVHGSIYQDQPGPRIVEPQAVNDVIDGLNHGGDGDEQGHRQDCHQQVAVL